MCAPGSRVAWYAAVFSVTAVAVLLRMRDIHLPTAIIWDENHFVRFSQLYISRSYFVDVHPPLGKMIVAAIGYWSNLNDSLVITDGLAVRSAEDGWYVWMRVCSAGFGIMSIVLSHVIMCEVTGSVLAAIITSTLIITDTASHSYGRLILLDFILISFILLCVWTHIRFRSALGGRVTPDRGRCYTYAWWRWLLLTGTMLGCTISIKYIGAFVVMLIGLRTVADIWNMYCDVRQRLTDVVLYVFRLILGLIILPVLVYCGIFSAQTLFLNDISKLESIGVHSAEFRLTMSANSSSSSEVMYGSQVTIMSSTHYAGYLSTSFDTYPPGFGAQQQVVALDPKLDELNYWIFRRFNEVRPEDVHAADYIPRPVADGDLVRLYSVITEQHLHTHRIPASMTAHMYQTTGYGEVGEFHAGGVWRLEIASEGVNTLKTIGSRFRLVNNRTGCVLRPGLDRYPSWGYYTWEAVCDPAGHAAHHPDQLWQIDECLNPRVPLGDFSEFTLSLPERMLEIHKVMFQTNSRLTLQEFEGENVLQRLLATAAWMWPVLYRGCPGHNGSDFSLYFIGSPQVYFINFIVLLFSPAVLTYLELREFRKSKPDTRDSHFKTYFYYLLLGWALHYIPFLFMSRILYFHHYLPSFFFSCLVTGLLYHMVMSAVDRIFAPSLSYISQLLVCSMSVAYLGVSFLNNWSLAFGVDPRISEHKLSNYFYSDSWRM